MKIPKTDDSGLNMTPMIDIVFQLILFFLFNLRFKSLDWRIESDLPTGYGIHWGPPVEQLPHIKVSLHRLDPEDPEHARTKVKVAGAEWTLPAAIPANEPARDAIFHAISARIKELAKSITGPGEIDTPLPNGGLVPHADVVRVIDAFLQADVSNVEFQGVQTPLPKRR